MIRKKDGCPKEVRKAVRAYARAVKLVADMADLPRQDSLAEYHWKEYLEEMETLLVHQLLTSFRKNEERERVLGDHRLGYLMEKVRHTERDWNKG